MSAATRSSNVPVYLIIASCAINKNIFAFLHGINKE